MKKVWLSVNSLEQCLLEIPATNTTGNYRLKTGRYGELYLSWQYLSGAKIWRENTAFNEQNEQCLWGDVLLVDMGNRNIRTGNWVGGKSIFPISTSFLN